jgi:hypothetical protein
VQQLLFATLWQCTAHTQDGWFFFFNFVHLAHTAPCGVKKIDYMNTYIFSIILRRRLTHTHTHTHTHIVTHTHTHTHTRNGGEGHSQMAKYGVHRASELD